MNYVKLLRTKEAANLLSQDPKAFLLLSLIALRAKQAVNEGKDWLKIGSALIGDHAACGLTRQEYRTALARLASLNLATTEATNEGNIGKLIPARVFELPEGGQPTTEATTNNIINTLSVIVNIKNTNYEEDIKLIVNYLNENAGKKYRSDGANTKMIAARLKDNFTVEDCMAVIDNKVADWKGTDFEKYLRIDTLFRPSHFEEYLNQTTKRNESIPNTQNVSYD